MGPDVLDQAQTYLLCENGAAVTFDPAPEVLDEILTLLEVHGTRPIAVLETTPWEGAENGSPGYALARRHNWFWAGPVRAWNSEGAVIRLVDRLLLELHPDATEEDVASGRRLPHVDLELPPFHVHVAPVAGEPGRVRFQVDGHDLPASDWLAKGVDLVRDGQLP